MQLGRNTINFLIFVATMVVIVCSFYFYMYAKLSIGAMEKDPRFIEIDSLRRKHFNLK
jgi:hypothetical protein